MRRHTMKRIRTVHVLIVLFSLMVMGGRVSAQKVDITVDGERVKDLATYMSTDDKLGRMTLTSQFQKMHEWAAEKFRSWGLEPGGEDGTYFQAVPITGRRATFAFNTGKPQMYIDEREFFIHYGDFTLDPRSATGKKMMGKVVYVGYGISAPDKGLDEYAGLDVSGKFVFALKGSPNDYRAPRSWFSPPADEEEVEAPEDWKVESTDSSKIFTAYEKGAAGILLFNPRTEDDPFARFRRRSVEPPTFTRDFFIISDCSERVYQWIFWKDPQESSRGFENRMNGLRSDIKAKKVRSFETESMLELKGYDTTQFFGPEFGANECRNTIAKMTGSDPELKNEAIVLGAHFDHLGIRNGQILNGADDNASGSAVVMEVARLIAAHDLKPKRTIFFCLWTGEELGLIGSRFWGDNPTAGMTMDQVVVNFNMDMVGMGEKIGAPGALNFPEVWDVIKKDMDEELISIVSPSEGGPGGSDHTPFIERGITSMALMTREGGGHPDYHDTGDDPEKLEADILGRTAQFVLQGTISAANETGSLVVSDRQHIFDGMRWSITNMNPDLKVGGGMSLVKAKDTAELSALIVNKIKEMKEPADTSPMAMYRRRMVPPPMATGLAGGQVVNYDPNFLFIAHAILGFGRIDVKGDDGIWFDDGLTEKGREIFGMLEDSSIVFYLIEPTKKTFKDVLDTAEKPFIVAEMTDFSKKQIAAMNEKDVLVCVDLDPTDVDGCVNELEVLKKAFGDQDNLILRLMARKDREEATRDLYMKLIGKGWTKEEIYAIGGRGISRGSRGNLDRFVPPPPPMPF